MPTNEPQWVTFYSELAKKIVEKKSSELKEILKGLIVENDQRQIKTSAGAKYSIREIKDQVTCNDQLELNPFLFFSFFATYFGGMRKNPGTWENMLSFMYDKLRLSSEIPSLDESEKEGLHQTGDSWLQQYKQIAEKDQSEKFSKLAQKVVAVQSSEKVQEVLQQAKECCFSSFNVSNMSGGMYWLNPRYFFPSEKLETWKQFVERALPQEYTGRAWAYYLNKGNSGMNIENIKSKLIANKQLILTGAPGTGKTYTARAIAAEMIFSEQEKKEWTGTGKKLADKLNEELTKKIDDDIPLRPRALFVQFHPGYDYSDFVEGIKPFVIAETKQVCFRRQDGIFMKFCKTANDAQTNSAVLDKNQKYIFIIDEINRADLSRVFGELFFGLEADYRGQPITTQYASMNDDSKFTIPPNVYIIGTMNDIDRSVESMDFALRRRFAWHEVTAEYSQIIIDAADISEEIKSKAKKRMANLNKAIIDPKYGGFGTEYQLGGAYFKKIEKYIGDDKNADWKALWDNHIAVILKEYLRGRKNSTSILKDWENAFGNEAEQQKTEGVKE